MLRRHKKPSRLIISTILNLDSAALNMMLQAQPTKTYFKRNDTVITLLSQIQVASDARLRKKIALLDLLIEHGAEITIIPLEHSIDRAIALINKGENIQQLELDIQYMGKLYQYRLMQTLFYFIRSQNITKTTNYLTKTHQLKH